jgi:hypothetical protein
VILVASGTSSDPTTTAMARAAREALGGDAAILVREVPQPPADEDALALGHTLGANAVVELLWKDAEHRRATLHVRVDPGTRWADRDIGFDPLDADAERGRTIGFALASMMPEEARAPQPVAPPPPQPPDDRLAPPPPPPEPPGEPLRWRGAVDAAGDASLGGNATGFGGALSGRWDFAPAFSLRVGVAARAGQVSAADASSLIVSGAVGIVWRMVPATTRRSFGLAARLDVLGIVDEVSRPATDGGASHASLVLPGADLALEASWLFAGRLALFAAVGGEAAFGDTPVFVHSERVATIAPVRGTFELGARVHF